jgi:hypothetical protein
VRRDFKDVLIIAYKDGKPIEIKKARLEEGKTPVSAVSTPAGNKVVYQVILGETLPNNLHRAVQQATSREIARTVAGGKTRYIVGPYNSREEAERVVDTLQQSGFNTVNLETVDRR